MILEQLMQVDRIESDFSRVHLLIDTLTCQDKNARINSNMFQITFGLVLSTIVQMKNSLVRFIEFERPPKETQTSVLTPLQYEEETS
jgi:hypothetical protein